MASTSDIRNGMVIEFKNGLYQIVEFLHVKPGKGAAFVRTKLKNIRTGQLIDNTFRTSEKLTEIRITAEDKQYLYFDGDFYVFMDNETFEQLQVPAEVVGDTKYFLIEGITVKMTFTPDREIVGIEPPISIVVTVTEAEPNVRGNTASGSGGKGAVIETGMKINVPFFIEAGEKIKIDTRTGQYIERA